MKRQLIWRSTLLGVLVLISLGAASVSAYTTIQNTATTSDAIRAEVTACAWNHAADDIEFTLLMTRLTAGAPESGYIIMLYNPDTSGSANNRQYGPGGAFDFGGQSSITVMVTAQDGGFDRSRACIPAEWVPVVHPVYSRSASSQGLSDTGASYIAGAIVAAGGLVALAIVLSKRHSE